MYNWTEDEWQRMVDEYYQEKVYSFDIENKRIKNVDIAFVGDSITDGYDLQRYFPEYITVNRGISADTSFGLEKRLKTSVYDTNAKVVVLLIGSNNVNTCLQNYEKILKGIKNNLPETNVIVQSIYPTNGELADRNEDIVKVNRQIEILCADYGYIYVDMHSHLLDPILQEFSSIYCDDGIHPNGLGYDVITKVLKPIINELI